MVAVKINAFGGMVPAIDDRLLDDQAATTSQNTWLYSGTLSGIAEPTFVRDLANPGYGKVYRIPNNYFDADHFSDAVFMEFPSIDTDVIRSPIVGDTYDRYYWASPVGRPMVNSLARVKAGAAPYNLGVPQPSTPTLIISGGASATTASRAYVTTYVTTFGEEGPPSTPVLGTGKVDATWATSFSAPSGSEITDYNLSKVRVYRTVTSSLGVAQYYFVSEQAISATGYADTLSDTTVSSNSPLESATWTGPPTDLVGLVSLPNGMIAGWRGSELWFCEPFRPHAWPAAYSTSVEYPIVGLGVLNQTLIILTAGYPMVATGIHPSVMSLSKLSALEPCLSRGGILSTPEGVYYPSPSGLMLIANGQASNVTQGLMLKEDWNALTKIATLRATRLGQAYFAFGSSRPGVFQTDAWSDFVQLSDFAGSYSGVIIDPTNQRVALNTLTSTSPTANVFNDSWSGEVMLIRDDKLYRLDISNKTAPRQALLWASKLFQSVDKVNFQALRVYFDVSGWTLPNTATRNEELIQTLQPNQYGLVRIYADKKLIMTRELRVSGELMRIPGGFKADLWQIEFEANVEIASVQMATSVKELKRV